MQLRSDADSSEVIQRIKRGDTQAFKLFFDTYANTLTQYLTRMGMRQEDAEDIVQLAFIYLWEHRSELRESASLRAFLFRIGYTRMLNHFRNTARLESIENEQFILSDSPQADARTEAADVHAKLKRTLQGMPEKRRTVFELCVLREFSYKETAEILDISVKTVENHMALALKTMRVELSEFHSPQK